MRDFVNFVATRRSIRKYRDTPISRKQILGFIKAATWAPSAHNAQPWRFYILSSTSTKKRLAKAMAAAYRFDLESDGEKPKNITSLVNASVTRFSNAPVLILACLSMQSMDSYLDEKRQQAEYVMAAQSVADEVPDDPKRISPEGITTFVD